MDKAKYERIARFILPGYKLRFQPPTSDKNDAASHAEMGQSATEPAESAIRRQAAVALPFVADPLAIERARVVELTKIARHAARLDIAFNLPSAIAEGVKPQAARERVLGLAADRDSETACFPYGTEHTAHDTNSKASIQAGFDRAFAHIEEKRGLVPRHTIAGGTSSKIQEPTR